MLQVTLQSVIVLYAEKYIEPPSIITGVIDYILNFFISEQKPLDKAVDSVGLESTYRHNNKEAAHLLSLIIPHAIKIIEHTEKRVNRGFDKEKITKLYYHVGLYYFYLNYDIKKTKQYLRKAEKVCNKKKDSLLFYKICRQSFKAYLRNATTTTDIKRQKDHFEKAENFLNSIADIDDDDFLLPAAAKQYVQRSFDWGLYYSLSIEIDHYNTLDKYFRRVIFFCNMPSEEDIKKYKDSQPIFIFGQDGCFVINFFDDSRNKWEEIKIDKDQNAEFYQMVDSISEDGEVSCEAREKTHGVIKTFNPEYLSRPIKNRKKTEELREKMGDYLKKIEPIKDRLEIADQSMYWHYRGTYEWGCGRFQEALNAYKQAYLLKKDFGGYEIARTLYNVSQVFYQWYKRDKEEYNYLRLRSILFCKKAIVCLVEFYGTYLNNLVVLYLERLAQHYKGQVYENKKFSWIRLEKCKEYPLAHQQEYKLCLEIIFVLKRNLSKKISSDTMDELYSLCEHDEKSRKILLKYEKEQEISKERRCIQQSLPFDGIKKEHESILHLEYKKEKFDEYLAVNSEDIEPEKDFDIMQAQDKKRKRTVSRSTKREVKGLPKKQSKLSFERQTQSCQSTDSAFKLTLLNKSYEVLLDGPNRLCSLTPDAMLQTPQENSASISESSSSEVSLPNRAFRTKTDGDCAFHAIFGYLNAQGIVEYKEAFAVRKKMAIRIECNTEEPLKGVIDKAIQAWITDDDEISEKDYYWSALLRKNYREASQKHDTILDICKQRFIEALQKDPGVVEFFKTISVTSSETSELYAAFQKVRADGGKQEADLLLLIQHNAELEALFNHFEKNMPFNYEWIISDEVKGEFAAFVGKPGQYLSQAEVAIIAYTFDVTVKFYTQEGFKEDPINPGMLQEVSIQYNGGHRGHFERLPDDRAMKSNFNITGNNLSSLPQSSHTSDNISLTKSMHTFHAKPPERSSIQLLSTNVDLIPFQTKKFGIHLEVTRKADGKYIIYEFNLRALWEAEVLSSLQKDTLRHTIETIFPKNRGHLKSNNVLEISFWEEDAQHFLNALQKILGFDNSILPGEQTENEQRRSFVH